MEVVSCVIDEKSSDLQTNEEINLIQNVPIEKPSLRSTDVKVSVEPVEQEVSQLECGVGQNMERSEITEVMESKYIEKESDQMISNANEIHETVGLEQTSEVAVKAHSSFNVSNEVDIVQNEQKELKSVSPVSPDYRDDNSDKLSEDAENEILKNKIQVSLSSEEAKSEKDQALETEVLSLSEIKVGCPPVFVVKPKHATVQVGKTIQLQCKVEG